MVSKEDAKEKIKKLIEQIDKEINEYIYKIYNIKEEEKKIIEESLKS